MTVRSGINTSKVVQAAAEMLNAEGPPALTLSRLAGRLGIQTPSLYNHVDGLPGLQRELAVLNARRLGDFLSEAALGRAGAEAVWAVAQAYREYIHQNPGLYLATLQGSGNQARPNPELEAAEERVVRVTLAAIASFGLNGDDSLHAVRALRSLVHGFATLELAGGFGLPLDRNESFRRMIEMLIAGMQRGFEAGVP